jgi:hypothetical protein
MPRHAPVFSLQDLLLTEAVKDLESATPLQDERAMRSAVAASPQREARIVQRALTLAADTGLDADAAWLRRALPSLGLAAVAAGVLLAALVTMSLLGDGRRINALAALALLVLPNLAGIAAWALFAAAGHGGAGVLSATLQRPGRTRAARGSAARRASRPRALRLLDASRRTLAARRAEPPAVGGGLPAGGAGPGGRAVAERIPPGIRDHHPVAAGTARDGASDRLAAGPARSAGAGAGCRANRRRLARAGLVADFRHAGLRRLASPAAAGAVRRRGPRAQRGAGAGHAGPVLPHADQPLRGPRADAGNRAEHAVSQAARCGRAGRRRRARAGRLRAAPEARLPPALQADAAWSERIDGRGDERRQLLQRLAAAPPARLLVVCHAASTPDRGTGRFLDGARPVPTALLLAPPALAAAALPRWRAWLDQAGRADLPVFADEDEARRWSRHG